MMGFFKTGYGSKLVNNSPAEQTAAIPVVTDTVEEDVAASRAQQQRQRNGLKSTLVSSNSHRSSRMLDDSTRGNITLG